MVYGTISKESCWRESEQLNLMISWIFLFVASLFEIGWMFSLKFISIEQVKKISFHTLAATPKHDVLVILPFLGYVFFGIGNIYCFSTAMKGIPTSTAFAVWMAVALAGVKLVEVFFFKEPIRYMDYFYLILLLVAIVGLKKN
jgi:quaternary ammonium compound-resistance protein SugE